MEVLFTLLLLIVPIFSVVSLCVSLIAIRNVKALKELNVSLISAMRGETVSPVDAAVDKYTLKV